MWRVCQVINYQQTLVIPSDACLSADTVDLILQLCCSASERLGRSPGGASQVKSHSFFAGLEFAALRRQYAPYIPHLRYATDTSHFDTAAVSGAELAATTDDDRATLAAGSGSLDSLRSTSALTPPESHTGGPLQGPCDGGRHAFLEFTFRRFFDADGHAHATRVTDGPAPVYV